MGLPEKLSLSKGKGLWELLKIVAENRFSGKTYFYTIAQQPRAADAAEAGRAAAADAAVAVHGGRQAHVLSPRPLCAGQGRIHGPGGR